MEALRSIYNQLKLVFRVYTTFSTHIFTPTYDGNEVLQFNATAAGKMGEISIKLYQSFKLDE